MSYTMNDAENFTPDMIGAEVIAGYLGGPFAAGQPWTDAQWHECGTKPKLGIWVPKPIATDHDARTVDLYEILNWALHFNWTAGQPVAFDLETSKADYSYMLEMAACLKYFRLTPLAYGSLSTINQAVPGNVWKWSASWTNTPHLDVGMHATQWANDTMAHVPYDQSLITPDLYSLIQWR